MSVAIHITLIVLALLPALLVWPASNRAVRLGLKLANQDEPVDWVPDNRRSFYSCAFIVGGITGLIGSCGIISTFVCYILSQLALPSGV